MDHLAPTKQNLKNIIPLGSPRHSTSWKVCATVIFAIAYFGAAEFGHLLSFPGDSASFWPPAGLALAAFWLLPFRYWPILLVATAIANITSDTAIHGKSLIVGAGFWFANSVETILAVALLKWWTTWASVTKSTRDSYNPNGFALTESSPDFLDSWHNILALLTLACTLATGLGALIGATVVSIAFDIPYWQAFRIWWAADALGMLVVGSMGLVVTWEWKSRNRPKCNGYVVILLLVLISGMATFIFGFQSLPITYVMLPPLFLLALLGEFQYSVAGSTLLSIIAIFCTTRGLGPFSGELPLYMQATLLQEYLAVCTVSTLMFTSIVRQHNLDTRRVEHHQQLQKFVFENSAVDIAWIAGDGSIWDANPQFCRSLGYPLEELLGLHVRSILPRYETVLWEQAWAEMKQAGVSQRESVMRRKNGTLIDVEVFVSFKEFLGNEFLLACATNITQRKRSTELITALVESSSDAHLIFNKTGIIECNQAAISMLRMESKQQLLLKHPAEFSPEFQPDGRTSLEKSIEMDALAQKKGYHRFDWIHTRADGEDFPCEVTLTPIQLESGDALLVVWHDISERVRFQAQLQAANEQLTVINEELKQFAYIASHDLKAPLRAINSLADFVIEDCADKLPDESLKHLGAIKQRICRMQRLLEDLLEYSQAGQDQGGTRTMSSRSVIEAAIELCEIPSAIIVELTGDDTELQTWITPLETCLRNLIGNSVKHRDRPAGRIRIHSEQSDDFITFSVADDGRGIPMEHHERIFRMFEALKRRDEIEGSGMGLAIVKKTVETYGGSIAVESPNAWAGTTFRLRWPNAGVDLKAGRFKS